MAFLAIAGIVVGIGSKLLSASARRDAEKRKAAALKENALVQFANTLSGLGAREREELAAARQQKRLGRRESARLEAQAKAAGASAGTGSAEQVQDVLLGKSEFLSSIDTQLGFVTAELSRRRRRARIQKESAFSAAESGLSGPNQDFLDFANTLTFAFNAFDALATPGSTGSKKKEDDDG